MIISRTPFRVSFFGGGTDYPVWFREHGGAVLSCTIDKYCYISARYLPPFFDYKHRVVWSRLETVASVDDIEHPSVRACLKHAGIERGIEIHHNGDLPSRTGLGSSSAFTVGMLSALHGLKGRMVSRTRLAEEAIHVEQKLLQEAVGVQDQIAVAHGGLNHIEIRTDGRFVVNPVILPPGRMESLQARMMLFFTGISRFASEIAQTQIQQTRAKVQELRDMAAMVPQSLALLNGQEPLSAFGDLLHESWLLKRGLTDKISNSRVDEIYETARRAGARGGKLLGAGGGGFMLLFAEPEAQPDIREALSGVLEIPIRLDFDGSRVIYCDSEHG
jgi:D-glycero-alpha-D-manno-heptose-7-phosphate kinase